MSLLGAAVGAAGSIIGSKMNAIAADNAADEAWDRQAKVLKKQIQWRVKDAQAAGIHPLAALGLTPAAGGPMASIGADWGSTLGNAGAELGRAAEAQFGPQDKVTAQLVRLQLERAHLENDLLRTQITSQRVRTMQQANPGLPRMTPSGKYVYPDGSLVPGDAGGGSKAIVSNPPFGSPFIVGTPGGAEAIEGNYGEIAGELWGAGAALNDLYSNYVAPYAVPADAWLGDVYKSMIPRYLADPGTPGEAPVFVW